MGNFRSRKHIFVLAVNMTLFSLLPGRVSRTLAFSPISKRAISSSLVMKAEAGQAEVILVGCGAPNRGMGWYHGLQMVEGKCPSASLDYIVEPWFLGGGADSEPGKEFGEWKDSVESTYGTKFAVSLDDLPPPE